MYVFTLYFYNHVALPPRALSLLISIPDCGWTSTRLLFSRIFWIWMLYYSVAMASLLAASISDCGSASASLRSSSISWRLILGTSSSSLSDSGIWSRSTIHQTDISMRIDACLHVKYGQSKCGIIIWEDKGGERGTDFQPGRKRIQVGYIYDRQSKRFLW